MTNSNRIPFIDECRGLAVLLMAIFHFCYDLSVFGFLTFEMNGGFFTWFRFLIVTLFFLSVGSSLYLGHSEKLNWPGFLKRQLKITAGAAFISISTFVMYPQAWVWFGVLHFIALASLIALPLVKWPTISLFTGLVIFVFFNFTNWFNLSFLYDTFSRPLHLPRATQDLTRLIPWLGMVLIGIYLGKVKYWGIQTMAFGFIKTPLNWLSKHSLIFYIVHQAPLLGIAWVLDWIIH